MRTWHSAAIFNVLGIFILKINCTSFKVELISLASSWFWPFSGLSLVLQGASVSSSQSTLSTAKPIWTAPVPAAPHQPLSSVWEDSASAPTARMGNLTASLAAPQSQRAAHYQTTSQRFLFRSCHTFTWAVPKIPPTWMCSASTILSISSTWRPTCPTCSNMKGTSSTSRSPSLITGARTSHSFSPRPFHSLVSRWRMLSTVLIISESAHSFLDY